MGRERSRTFPSILPVRYALPVFLSTILDGTRAPRSREEYLCASLARAAMAAVARVYGGCGGTARVWPFGFEVQSSDRRIAESSMGVDLHERTSTGLWFPAARKAGGCDTVAGSAKPVASTPFLPDQPHTESGCCPPSSPAEPASTPRHCSCSVGLLTVAATMVLLVAEL